MLDRFNYFHEKFSKSELARAMMNEREDSPWHRESSVWRHTQMLLDWYKDNLFSSRSDGMRMLTMVASLMHDIGKPSSRIVTLKEDGSEKRGYHGHEIRSARMWINFAVDNSEVRDLLRFNMEDISFVALMLEHHVPFALKKVAKREALKSAFFNRKGEQGHQAWLDLLMSDQMGRISDNKADKIAKVEEWMEEWKLVRVSIV